MVGRGEQEAVVDSAASFFYPHSMPKGYYPYFGIAVNETTLPISRELYFIAKGGRWKRKSGKWAGNGLFYHYLEAIKLLWPELKIHRWLTTFLEAWLAHDYVGVIGPKNSGKSCGACVFHLTAYYSAPECTTVAVCSSTREMLESRIWGEIKKFHRAAKERYNWLPGYLIEGRQRLVTDDRFQSGEGRDFRNGCMGIPLKRGNQIQGISDIIGWKNKRKFLCADELQCLPKSVIDGTANFFEPGADCKFTGMGNPADTTDALGVLCEPHTSLGGWEGGIDQTPKTKVWKTRFDGGICVQLPGDDSPNYDVPANAAPPYPFLMTRDQMEKDARTWGENDWHYTMFNKGRMPRGQGSRRVITAQLVRKHGAKNPPVWLNSSLTYITALDAAYRAVGGDRCVFMRMAFGPEAELLEQAGADIVASLIDQREPVQRRNTIFALLDTFVVPIADNDFEAPEDQIVMFCKAKHEGWNLGPEALYLDAGMRMSLVTAFGRLWSPKVNTVDFGGKPTERRVSHDIDVSCRDYYSKFVTELWYSVRLAIESDQVRGLTEEVVSEGCAREWMMVAGNKIEVEPKADMKLKTGRSPDLFDCLVIGLEGARRKGFVIRRSLAPQAAETDTGWKREMIAKAAENRKSRELNYAA